MNPTPLQGTQPGYCAPKTTEDDNSAQGNGARAIPNAKPFLLETGQPTRAADTPITNKSITVNNQSRPNSASVGGAGCSGDIINLPNHTYKPYVWISHAANKAVNKKFKDEHMQNNPEVIRQLLLSERKAKKDFLKRLEYRHVNYGYDPAVGITTDNYGVFAREPIKEGDVLGIYSGVIYLSMNPEFNIAGIKARESDPGAYIQEKLQLPDEMSYLRTQLQALRDGGNQQRTPEKFRLNLRPTTGSDFINILPDNERYTPMHFINSADSREDINVQYKMSTLKIDSYIYLVPTVVASRDIEPGKELLANYMVERNESIINRTSKTAQSEKEYFESELNELFDFASSLTREGIQISTHVAAPVHYLPEDLRKALREERKTLQKTDGLE